MAAGRGSVLMSELAANLPADHGGLLVVDDEPFLRDAVAASLRFLGFEVTTADTGVGALRLARDRRFDLVVLDVMLPDTDGFEVVRRLRRDGCRVPVIFLTARDTQADKVTGLTIGGDDYLTKPFGLEELAGPDPQRAAPHPPGPRGRAGAHVRRHRAGPGQLPGPPVRPGDRAVADRVPAAALPHAQPGTRAYPGAAAGPRVGLRLRRVEHGRRHVHRLPAAHTRPTRPRRDPHPAGRRLHAAIAPRGQRRGRAAMRLRRPRRALLRTRVLSGVLLVTLVALAAFDIAGVTALRTYLTGQTDSQLQNLIGLYRLANSITQNQRLQSAGLSRPPRATPPANWISTPPNAKFPAQEREQLRAPFLQPFSVELVTGKYVKGVSPSLTIKGIVVGGGGLIPRLGSQKDLDALAASGQAWTATSLHGNEPLRVLARPGPGSSLIVAYTSLDGVNRTVGQLELILVIGSVAAGLLAAGGVAWIMRRGLRPIETMAGQADAINAGDLTSRVGPQDPRTEVGRLGVALNGMLARIEHFITEREASQEATRRFFADASHELRTPLASLRANAELYQQGALTERPQVDEAMRRITLEAMRMSGLA